VTTKTDTTTPPKGLALKLAEIMGEVHRIGKAGFNENQKYAFVKESDVSDAIRPLLAERHIWLWSDTVEVTERNLFTTASGATMWKAHVLVAYQFIDGETGEVTPVQHYPGDGADTGDKALPKAQAMSLKYFLLKTFMLSTGADDAEGDEKVDKAAAAAGAAKGPLKITKGTQAGVERGGKASVVTSAQIKEIARLIGELNLDAAVFGDIVSKVAGVTVEGKTGKEILAQLTAEQAGDLVTALSGMETFADMRVDKPVDTVENADGDDPQEPFAVV